MSSMLTTNDEADEPNKVWRILNVNVHHNADRVWSGQLNEHLDWALLATTNGDSVEAQACVIRQVRLA